MPSSLTHRLAALLAVSIAAAVAGCSDSTSIPTTPTAALDGRSPTATDTARPTTPAPTATDTTPKPRPDSSSTPAPRPDTVVTTPPPRPPTDTVVARPDSQPTGRGVVWGLVVRNAVTQWRDSNGVVHDSAGYRGIAGVTVTLYAWTYADSTSRAPSQERQLGTFQTDATGQFRTGALPDGWYKLRAATTGSPEEKAEATAELRRGNQLPSIVFLNLR